MWGWFGGGAAQKRKDTPKNAILGLRAQLEMLQKRERHLQTQIDEQDGIARKNVNTNKNAAKAALRRKKTHEHSLDQTVSQIGTLEQQINAIESANINRETLVAMEKASQAMAQIHGKLTPEKVDETMCVLEPLYQTLPFVKETFSDFLIQGEIARAQCHERRDCRRHDQRHDRRLRRRRRSGRGVGAATTGAARRANAHDRQCARVRCSTQDAHAGKHRASIEQEAGCGGRRRRGRVAKVAS